MPFKQLSVGRNEQNSQLSAWEHSCNVCTGCILACSTVKGEWLEAMQGGICSAIHDSPFLHSADHAFKHSGTVLSTSLNKPEWVIHPQTYSKIMPRLSWHLSWFVFSAHSYSHVRHSTHPPSLPHSRITVHRCILLPKHAALSRVPVCL